MKTAFYIIEFILLVYIWWAVKLTVKGRVVKASFRWWGVALLALCFTGCTYNYPYSYSSINTGAAPVNGVRSQYTIVNNSGYRLKIHQDGKYVGEAQVGQVVPVKGTLLWQKTVVTVTGYDAQGNYVGSDSWIYEFGTPEAWTVHRLNKPREPR